MAAKNAATAILNKDYSSLISVLRQKLDVNRRTIYKKLDCTLLYIAVLMGELEAVRLLLVAKADPNICASYHIAPLYVAVVKQRLDIVKLLCDYGADVDIQTEHKETVLHAALRKNDAKIVEYLLEKHCDMSGVGINTPMFIALAKNSKTMCRLLQLHGFNCNKVVDHCGNTLMHLCALYCPTSIPLAIELNIDINKQNIDGCTAGHLLKGDGKRMLALMLINGLNPEIKNNCGDMCLQ